MEDLKDCTDSQRKYLLPERLPEIFNTNAVQLRNINHDAKEYFRPDFFYSGAGLLSPEGKNFVVQAKPKLGKCLGGGVFASRDLEWVAAGRNGNQPGAFIPRKKFIGYDNEPQSHLPSEWITFEHALALIPPYGKPLVLSWDEVNSVVTTLKQGRDLHIRIDGSFGSGITQINGQANSMAMTNLRTIAGFAGVPVFA